MFVSHQREKLLNAIIYFIANTKRCHTLKLFKLLYFLDFEHFRQTGQGVTGLRYVAWPKGPAPDELWRELDAPRPDLAKAVSVIRRSGRDPDYDLDAQAIRDNWETRDNRDIGYPTYEEKRITRRDGGGWDGPPRRDIQARRRFNPTHFTKRDFERMREIVSGKYPPPKPRHPGDERLGSPFQDSASKIYQREYLSSDSDRLLPESGPGTHPPIDEAEVRKYIDKIIAKTPPIATGEIPRTPTTYTGSQVLAIAAGLAIISFSLGCFLALL